MEPDFLPLAGFLSDEFDGYLISTDGNDSNQLYLSGFDAPDPYVTLYTPAEIHLLVSTLEFDHAKKESCTDTASRLSDYDYRDNHAKHDAVVGKTKTVTTFLAGHRVDSFAIPADFPLGTANALREEGVAVDTEAGDVLANIRTVRANEGVERIHAAQGASEVAIHIAGGLIRDTDMADGGTLAYEGEPLTSGYVREGIEVTLLRYGCALDETIVACRADATDPRNRRSGSLRAGETVIIDIFPRNEETKYNGDMTRTFVKNEPLPEIRGWFDLIEETSEAAPDAVEPGVTGKDTHDAVCDMYETAGESALRVGPPAETGFIHSTSHNVGLDVHELPSLSPSGKELRPGHATIVEPGLYDPEIGDAKIEDLMVATEDGYESLTEYPVELIVE